MLAFILTYEFVTNLCGKYGGEGIDEKKNDDDDDIDDEDDDTLRSNLVAVAPVDEPIEHLFRFKLVFVGINESDEESDDENDDFDTSTSILYSLSSVSLNSGVPPLPPSSTRSPSSSSGGGGGSVDDRSIGCFCRMFQKLNENGIDGHISVSIIVSMIALDFTHYITE
ncbi:hypothetical protein BLOT_014830 [Blomia tropicalis]|nr:hypothetical protein BLOT_014830 [Blomia tropicalis]